MLKPMLHQKTQDKVVITGSDPQVITEVLEKYISKDQFPEKYGGYVKLQYPVIFSRITITIIPTEFNSHFCRSL